MFLSGYARLDYRLTEEGQFYLLEANPNPQIAENEDFADSAAHSGLPYDQLLQKIMTVGMNTRPPLKGAELKQTVNLQLLAYNFASRFAELALNSSSFLIIK